jgi:hypothetical protein
MGMRVMRGECVTSRSDAPKIDNMRMTYRRPSIQLFFDLASVLVERQTQLS